VTRGRSAQKRPAHLRHAPLVEIGTWLTHYSDFFEGSLDRLGEHLARLQDRAAASPPDSKGS